MKMPKVIVTNSASETRLAGERLGAVLGPGEVVCLWGDLGAGKTCLVQGICRGLGVNEVVVSPTFTLVNEYTGKYTVAHLDFYRLKGVDDLEQLGFNDLFDGTRIVLIEWPDRAAGALPKDRLDVHLVWLSDDKREIKFTSNLRKYADLIEK